MLIPPILGWLCPKGQVTRAQEAEENYLVKRELATVKQQSEEAGAELERAKTLIRQLQQQQQQQPNAVRRALASQELRSSRTGPWWQGCVHSPLVYWHLRLTLSRCRSWKCFRNKSDASVFPSPPPRLWLLSRVTLALGNLFFAKCMNPLWDTLCCTVQPPFTAWCILRRAPIHVSVVRVVVFTYGILLSEDSPSIGS